MGTVTEIPSRWRSRPWFLDHELAPPTRRDDLFIDPAHVYAALNTALAAGRPVSVIWMALEYDEDFGRERPVERNESGLAVMDLEGSSETNPLGWAYLLSPGYPTVFILSLDVVTDIHIEL